jgi:hypothetical protein
MHRKKDNQGRFIPSDTQDRESIGDLTKNTMEIVDRGETSFPFPSFSLASSSSSTTTKGTF